MCAECGVKHVENRKRSNKVYNSHNRDKDIDSFYKTKEWIDTREYVLTKYNYIDLYDYFINHRITTANTVHHILEIRDNYDLRIDEDNLIPVSSKSHNKIHKLYNNDKETIQNKLKEILKMAKKIGLR